MALRVFLGLSALVWLPYGLYCLANPEYLAEVAGVSATSTTALIELRAMYGGLQAAIGGLCLAALVRPALVTPALVTSLFLCAGLATARAIGVMLEGEISGYTAGGLAFEVVIAGSAGWLLAMRGTEAQVAPAA